MVTDAEWKSVCKDAVMNYLNTFPVYPLGTFTKISKFLSQNNWRRIETRVLTATPRTLFLWSCDRIVKQTKKLN
jgi:hypothetical protein